MIKRRWDIIEKFVEKIGLDRTVVSGFRIIKIDYKKLFGHDNVVFDAAGENLYWLEDGNGFRWLKISDHKLFGVLRAGVKISKRVKQDFARLDIMVGDSLQGNLQNKSVSEYKDIIEKTFRYLGDEYGIYVDLSLLKFSEMEINCTFVLQKEFYQYHRVLQLMMFLLPKNYKKIIQVLGVNSHQCRLESETYYRGNSSMQVKIYDKQKHLEQTVPVTPDLPLMRIEFILKKSQKIKEVFSSNSVWELTDEKLNDFYYRQFLRLFEAPYRKWQIMNGKMLRDKIDIHKGNNIKLWKSNLLAECSNREQLDQIPMLLDINDLLVQVRKQEKGHHFSRVAKGILGACESNEVYLQNDSLKIEEIINKIHELYERYKKANKTDLIVKKPIHGNAA